MSKNGPILDILISTIGIDGIQRIVKSNHPHIPGVRYVIIWQQPYTDEPIPPELKRDDMVVHIIHNQGLSLSRNKALECAEARFILIADDDISYYVDGIIEAIQTLELHPEYDIITFRYDSERSTKIFPVTAFDHSKAPKGYYVTSFEIAMRRESIMRKRIKFSPLFGIGAIFPSGEEDLFLHHARQSGLKAAYFPITICRHDGLTTTERRPLAELIRTKGAVFSQIFPKSWILRLITHAWRNRNNELGIIKYMYIWLNGVRQYRQLQKTSHRPNLS